MCRSVHRKSARRDSTIWHKKVGSDRPLTVRAGLLEALLCVVAFIIIQLSVRRCLTIAHFSANKVNTYNFEQLRFLITVI